MKKNGRDRTLWAALAVLAVTAGLVAPATRPAIAADYRSTLVDGFEGDDFAIEGGLYYRKNFEQSAGTVEFQPDVVRNGKKALKLSVKPICPKNDNGCSERAEIWERSELRVPYDQGAWFGFAIKFGEPVPQDDHRYLIAQWKREIGAGATGDYSPFFALRLENGKLFATVESNLLASSRQGRKGEAVECPPGLTPAWLRPETNQTRTLVAVGEGWSRKDSALFNACTSEVKVTGRGGNIPPPESGWIDFVVYTRPGPAGGGRIELFANDRWIATIEGRIGHADEGLGRNQYFKFGPYRAAHRTEWTLYYDDFRRSMKCADMNLAATCPF